MSAERIIVETVVAAPIAAVWRAYVTPEDIKQWNAASDDWHTTAATVDLRMGGAFSSRMEAKDGSFGFDFAGTYTNIVDEKLIEYDFGDRRRKSSSRRARTESWFASPSIVSQPTRSSSSARAGRRS